MMEIERKFLVLQDKLPPLTGGIVIRQAYLMVDKERSLRIRQKDDRYILSVKINAGGISRHEHEFDVPAEKAEALFQAPLVGVPVEKRRYLLEHSDHTWELDIFEGALAGLIVAEIELTSEEEAFDRPAWLGDEVTHDTRYLNSNLALNGLPV